MKTRLFLAFGTLLLSLPGIALAQTEPGANPPASPPPATGDTAAPAPAATPTASPTATMTAPPAETPPPPEAAPAAGSDRGAAVIGLKIGGLFPEPFAGRLQPSYLLDVELGYVLPVLNRSLGVLVDVGYTQPTASGMQTDPRVTANGGTYTWNLTEEELLLGFTVMFRVTQVSQRFTPYVGVGPRIWFVRSHVHGEAGTGNTISETTEQSTQVGLSVPIGLDVALGPGRVFLEGLILWAPIQHTITGESSVGSLDVLVGYRLWL